MEIDELQVLNRSVQVVYLLLELQYFLNLPIVLPEQILQVLESFRRALGKLHIIKVALVHDQHALIAINFLVGGASPDLVLVGLRIVWILRV